MLSTATMRRILDKHDIAQRAYLESYYRMNTGAANVYGRFEPATALELDAAKQFWKRPYPASYRTFLRINNGWRRFGVGWSLIGAPTTQNKDMYMDVKNTLRQLSTVATREEQAVLEERQKKNPKVILSTDHTVIGTDFNGGLLVFDGNRVSAAREPQVAQVDAIVHVVDRWDNFEAFLLDVASRVEQRLKKIPSQNVSKAEDKRFRRKASKDSPSRAKRS